MIMCANDFHECGGEKIEHSRKCDVFIECTTCFFGRTKQLDSCCTQPNIIFVNQPNINGNPSKKPYCTNCGYTTKPVKFINGNEHLTLPLITKTQSDKQVDERHAIRLKFNAWLKEKREKQISKLEQEYTQDYQNYLLTPKWKDKRAKVLKRDNFICQSCLDSPAVDVHHLTYLRIFDEPLFDLISVCRECHNKIHPEKRNAESGIALNNAR